MDIIVSVVAVMMNVFAMLDIWLILWLLFGCDMKISKRNILIAMGIFIVLNVIGAIALQEQPTVLFLGICSYYVIGTMLLAKSRRIKTLFLVIPAVLVYSQWGSFLNLIEKLTTLDQFCLVNSQGDTFTLIGSFSDALLCLTLFCLSRTKVAKSKSIQLTIGEGIFLSVFCFLSPTIVMGLEWFEGMVNAPAYSFTWIVFMIVLNVAVVYAIVHRKKATYYKHLSEGYKEEFESEYSVFRDYKEQQLETIKFRHDWKNHMLLLQEMMEQGQYEKAEQYFKELAESTDKSVRKVTTGNELVDMIVSSKMGRMEEQDIELCVNGDMAWFDNMKQVDCCILISNLIDNAIEANGKVKENRYIFLRARRTEKMFYFEIKNSMEGVLQREEQRIVSTKDDKERHGIGLQNVYDIINSYNGQYQITTENQEYTFQMVFSL